MPPVITAYLQLLIVFQCLVVVLFLLAGARRDSNNWFLALLLAFFAAHLGWEFLQQTGVLEEAISPAQLSGLLYGPLFYLWVRRQPMRARQLVHAVPFGIAHVLLAIRMLGDDALAIAIFISCGVYLVRSARVVSGGMRIAVGGFATIYVLDLLSFGTASVAASVTLFGAVLLFITSFGFASVRRPELFAAVLPRAVWSDEDERELALLEACLTGERLFLEPDLTVARAAERRGLTARRVSALINRGRAKSFTEWVNDHRVEEARRLLAAENETVLAVAYASGFHSKSAFNAAFKQRTGLTPSEFRRQKAS